MVSPGTDENRARASSSATESAQTTNSLGNKLWCVLVFFHQLHGILFAHSLPPFRDYLQVLQDMLLFRQSWPEIFAWPMVYAWIKDLVAGNGTYKGAFPDEFVQ
jgi:hypothetical protein